MSRRLTRRLAAILIAIASLGTAMAAAVFSFALVAIGAQSSETARHRLDGFHAVAAKIERLDNLNAADEEARARDIQIIAPSDKPPSLDRDNDYLRLPPCVENCVILRTWAGEWFEYYIHPTGSTTVPTAFSRWMQTVATVVALLAIPVLLAAYARSLWKRSGA